jgi:alcohol dehydrogenase
MLPHVLRFLSPAIRPQLAVLGLRAKVGHKNDSEAVLAQKFLDSIDAMNTRLGIPATLESLREDDVAALARAACREADTNYPVPLYLSQAECEAVIRQVLPAHAASKPKARKTAARRKPKAAPV